MLAPIILDECCASTLVYRSTEAAAARDQCNEPHLLRHVCLPAAAAANDNVGLKQAILRS
jgi:hypothetical protein